MAGYNDGLAATGMKNSASDAGSVERSAAETAVQEACRIICGRTKHLREMAARIRCVANELHGSPQTKPENAGIAKEADPSGLMPQLHEHIRRLEIAATELEDATRRL